MLVSVYVNVSVDVMVAVMEVVVGCHGGDGMRQVGSGRMGRVELWWWCESLSPSLVGLQSI